MRQNYALGWIVFAASLAMPLFAGLDKVHAQDGPSILEYARENVGDSGLSYHNGRNKTWLQAKVEGPVHHSNSTLVRIAKEVRVGQTLKMRELLQGQDPRPGDMVRLTWNDGGVTRPLILVYAGEESFPDNVGGSRSFFIFPYRTQLEYNTFPVRRHEKFMQDRWRGFDLGELFADFGSADAKRGEVKWMRPSVFYSDADVFCGTSFLPGSTADVFRYGKAFDLLVKHQRRASKGSPVYAIVVAPGDVGLESSLRRQSFVNKGAGRRRVELGPLNSVGPQFVAVKQGNKFRTYPFFIWPEADNGRYTVTTSTETELVIRPDLKAAFNLFTAPGYEKRWERVTKKFDWKRKMLTEQLIAYGETTLVCGFGALAAGGSGGAGAVAMLPCAFKVASTTKEVAQSLAFDLLKAYVDECVGDPQVDLPPNEAKNIKALLNASNLAFSFATAPSANAVQKWVAGLSTVGSATAEYTLDGKSADVISVTIKQSVDTRNLANTLLEITTK